VDGKEYNRNCAVSAVLTRTQPVLKPDLGGMDSYSQYQQPTAGYGGYHTGPSGSSSTAPYRPANAYEYDVGAAAQASAYVPGAASGRSGGAGDVVPKGGKRTTVLRKGAGKVWEDQTLLEWDTGTSTFNDPYIVYFALCSDDFSPKPGFAYSLGI
jgi:hypothetical protein